MKNFQETVSVSTLVSFLNSDIIVKRIAFSRPYHVLISPYDFIEGLSQIYEITYLLNLFHPS